MKKFIFLSALLFLWFSGSSQDFNAEWPHGTEATVIATPNPGWEFISWTENGVVVSTENPYTFTVTGPRDLEANFKILSYLIEIIVVPPNSGVIEGFGDYPPGAEVMLYSIPDEYFEFDYFIDLASGDKIKENPYSFIAEENRILSANFVSTAGFPSGWIALVFMGLIFIFAILYRKSQTARK